MYIHYIHVYTAYIIYIYMPAAGIVWCAFCFSRELQNFTQNI